MASALKSAIPSHLKPSAAEKHTADDKEFKGRHHGKTQSHMVSQYSLVFQVVSQFFTITNYCAVMTCTNEATLELVFPLQE
jgi:hypothetical protein